ncbi:Eco57I restriction-modification methylase domain-containing protein [Altererythrobacter sp. C41]|uniref:Eco57I restriction-modification methylase domain-containing protein n=1 Tax=Altererythrobacter sp. C41 TaxID=2806021 RepID=UPI0019315EC9|nr:N-6 DNA methylase [Altererythrobacter sp. C41]MBM0169186.1 N-6 DNA methylase [Altererythrobacter sp. C41]
MPGQSAASTGNRPQKMKEMRIKPLLQPHSSGTSARMGLTDATLDLLQNLARKPGHDEVKAYFSQLLVEEFDSDRASLRFEKRQPEICGRLDALIGRTVLEAKRDLDRELPDVQRRMPDYLADCEREHGEPFVGIASDGRRWIVYELAGGELVQLKETTLDPERGEAFLAWLDGVLALKGSLPPDALTIRTELGPDSIAFKRVDRELRALWEDVSTQPAEALKRQLWADMLKLVYGREVDDPTLWFRHSYLVIVTKCIALAVMDLREDDPKRMLSGEAFASAGITGAVESDFFDWMAATPRGEDLVRKIMAHVRRFRLREVESDVLKILYESLIDATERHGLGEYYTPDWLAAKVVRNAVDRPLEQRVLDPACGSGTFLFHAVRCFLREAEDAGLDPRNRAAEACKYIAGVDIHPVAVIIARVTFLLALAPALGKRAGGFSIPVYLGDSMQLSIKQDMIEKELVIQVPPPKAGEGKREQLGFPETFCRDPGLFDKAIEAMRAGSLARRSREQVEAQIERETRQHYQRETNAEEDQSISDLGATYETFHKLRLEGRDTIWSYVARNLSRPLALASGGGWANVLVGNPPWVAYRHMSTDLQKRFKELAKGERIYVGDIPSHNDLCALFVARSSHLYLRPSGTLAFVLPLAALTRAQFAKFRTGQFASYNVAWNEAWTMDDSVVPLFPVPSCVLFGRKRAIAKATPSKVKAFSGALPMRDASEKLADSSLTERDGVPAPETAQRSGGSPYRNAFRQGAILIPRAFVLVERKASGRLGSNPEAPLVVSRRSPLEKAPWKDVPSLESNVEKEFIRPVLLGESILPYRLFAIFEGAIPTTAKGEILSSASAGDQGYSHLASWLASAEQAWAQNGKGKRNFSEQLDYIGQLSAQFPPAPLRVIYAKAGTQPAAFLLKDAKAVIDHMLYWMPVSTAAEGNYLCAIINSERTRSSAEHFQARGQFGARHFDKVIWNLPIPRFNPKERLHSALAAAGARAEQAAATVELVESEKFQRARRRVREALIADGVAGEIDELVEKLLDTAAGD